MVTISISEEVYNNEDAIMLLDEIKHQIAQGYTSGFYPTWSLEGDEESSDEEN